MSSIVRHWDLKLNLLLVTVCCGESSVRIEIQWGDPWVWNPCNIGNWIYLMWPVSWAAQSALHCWSHSPIHRHTHILMEAATMQGTQFIHHEQFLGSVSCSRTHWHVNRWRGSNQQPSKWEMTTLLTVTATWKEIRSRKKYWSKA